MRFYRNLYVSEELENKRELILTRLKKGKYPITTYLLVLIEDGPNQLELFSTSLLHQKMIADHDYFVVGIASGYFDAVYMVEDIAKEVYEKTGGLDIRSYIIEREINRQEL